MVGIYCALPLLQHQDALRIRLHRTDARVPTLCYLTRYNVSQRGFHSDRHPRCYARG